MLIVNGLVELKPESVEAFKEIGRPMIEASRAEPGCHGYSYYQDITNPCVFRAYEQWENEAALKVHFETPHLKTFETEMRKLQIVKVEVIKYDRAHVRSLRG